MQVDPFTVPVDRSLAVLLAVDKELRHNPGVSLAEAAMQFEKRRQVFVSTLGCRDRPDAVSVGRGLFGAVLTRMARSRSARSRTPSAGSFS